MAWDGEEEEQEEGRSGEGRGGARAARVRNARVSSIATDDKEQSMGGAFTRGGEDAVTAAVSGPWSQDNYFPAPLGRDITLFPSIECASPLPLLYTPFINNNRRNLHRSPPLPVPSFSVVKIYSKFFL